MTKVKDKMDRTERERAKNVLTDNDQFSSVLLGTEQQENNCDKT